MKMVKPGNQKLIIIGDLALCDRDRRVMIDPCEPKPMHVKYQYICSTDMDEPQSAHPFYVPDLTALAWCNDAITVGYLFMDEMPDHIADWRLQRAGGVNELVINGTDDIAGSVKQMQSVTGIGPDDTLFITPRPVVADAVIVGPDKVDKAGAIPGHGLIKASLETYIPDYMDEFLSRTVPDKNPDPPSKDDPIKMIFFDKDGTLTDGIKFVMANNVVANRFYSPDLAAIRQLRDQGMDIGIISGDPSRIGHRLGNKLNIPDDSIHVQADEAKIECMRKSANAHGHDLCNVAFVGDSYNDIAPMADLINAGGQAFCPADAVSRVQELDGITVLNSTGGNGVAGEIVSDHLK